MGIKPWRRAQGLWWSSGLDSVIPTRGVLVGSLVGDSTAPAMSLHAATKTQHRQINKYRHFKKMRAYEVLNIF